MPPTSQHDRYLLHLNHALAMESALVDHLEKRAAAVASPRAREQFLRHRDETAHHREIVREIIESLQGEPTASKANVQPPIAASLVGKVMDALEREKEDRALADDLADFAVENYEAAFYGVLILIARSLGFGNHVSRFDAIRQQEQAMADAVAARLPLAVREAFPPLSQAA
ncbi:MAG TPA: DUF892 family protein [Terriglobales bacterium]|nr:DUF892 family protein [Terriglobales bacterium]